MSISQKHQSQANLNVDNCGQKLVLMNQTISTLYTVGMWMILTFICDCIKCVLMWNTGFCFIQKYKFVVVDKNLLFYNIQKLNAFVS